MADKYFIANGNKIISTVKDKVYAPVVGSIDLAARFKYNDGLNFIRNELKANCEWSIQKVFSSKSGKNYIITNATNFAGIKGTIKNQIGNAKAFRNVAEAEAYIKNHRELVRSFGETFIINEKFEVFNQSAGKKFTDEQLEILGVKKRDVHRVILTKAARSDIYNRDDKRCSICGKPLKYDDVSIDHIIPISRGGTNAMDNLRCTCEDCNKLKSNRLDDEMYLGLSNICSIKALEDPYNEAWNMLIRAKVRGTIKKYEVAKA